MKDLLNFSLINIDKPAGPTSYSISEFIQRQLNLSKTSHMGTLDPKVTGVLPITLGRACKLAGYFIKHDKSYVGVLETHKEQDIKKLQKLIDNKFMGKILQTPPHRSAVKREEREREVYSWKLTEASEDNKSFLFETRVQGGTYIRKLCSDLGDMIGGAHMGELRRTEAGIFDESTLVKLDDFVEAVKEYKIGNEARLKKMLLPAEDAIRKVLPVVEVDKSAIKALHMGKPLLYSNVKGDLNLKPGEVFALFYENQFIGVYKKTDEENIFGRSEFVFN
ncbi:MAG: RNA-guided pseudouridylation complex pseudouridine synthase subunit Cbf5 [Nanoarchaeota archaeon]|nr:RNA-guided pseudouridylation complex pseudouridine synthase subunit Cbf5 [Nanoarchaeota archaeon]